MVEAKPQEGAASLQRPLILDYSNYRKFLEDFYHYKKSLRSGFSFRRFSQLVGISSPNYLQLVMKDQRNLSPELAEKIGKVLGLSAAENDYFCAMVQEASSPNESELAESQKKKLVAIRALVTKPIAKDQVRVLQEWYHLIVRELVLLPDFQTSGEWISKRLKGTITAAAAEESLELLLRSGFLTLDENQKCKQADPVIDTGEGFQEAAVVRLHLETIKMWSQFIVGTSADQRELGLLSIPIAAEKIPELKRRIQNFQDEIIGWIQDEKNPNQVVQLGTYLIPIA